MESVIPNEKKKQKFIQSLFQVLHLKITDKKAELDDTISYYSQREAEYETKIDELMTRLQEQTATYMKLQAEFDNYEWYEDGEGPETVAGGEEGEGEEGGREGTMSRRSRESPMLRSRPPTRPPTREEVILPENLNFSNVSDSDLITRTKGDIVRHRAGLLVEEDDPPEVIISKLCDSDSLSTFLTFNFSHFQLFRKQYLSQHPALERGRALTSQTPPLIPTFLQGALRNLLFLAPLFLWMSFSTCL